MNLFKLFGAGFLSLSWLVPNHYPPWNSFYNDSSAAFGLLLLALGCGRNLIAKPAPVTMWVTVAVAMIATLQWTFGQLAFSGDAVVSVLYLMGFASAIGIGYSAASSDAPATARLLATSVLLASLISCILALSQALQLANFGIWSQDVRPGTRVFANLGQPNNLATLIGLGSVSLLLLREQRRVSAWLAALLLGTLLIGIALSQSRIALAFGPVIAIGIWVANRRGSRFLTMPLTIFVIWLVQCLLTWAWPYLQQLLLFAPQASLAERGIGSPRYLMWSMLLDAIWHSPWIGYGWLQVGAAQLVVVNQNPSSGEMWLQAHNLFLDLLLWCGIPLGSVLIALVLCWFGSRTLRISSKEAVTGMLALAVLGLHSMVEFPYQYAYFLIPAGLWIGQIEWSVRAFGFATPKWNLVPHLVSVTLLMCICKDYKAVEDDWRLVRFETLRIGDVRAAYSAPDAPFMSGLTSLLRFIRTEPRVGMTDAELAEADAVTRRYPFALSLAQLAEMQALNRRLPQAVQNFESIRRMYPPTVYSKLRTTLRGRASEGQTGLTDLDRSLVP